MAADEHLSPSQFGFVEGNHDDWVSAMQSWDGKGQRTRVNLATTELHTGQRGIFPERVKEYVERPGMASATSRDLPVEIYQHQGKTWIGEGHHRVAAARQRGQKTIRAVRFGS